MRVHNLKEIKVWHKSIELCTEIYIALENFPKEEKYGLTSQIKRSAVSIASNIAEGAGRNFDKEFIQFLGIANGSCFELLTQLLIAVNLGLLDSEKSKSLCQKVIEIQKMIFGLRKRLIKEINK
ncbi:four helix bundle protein [Sphingobacterium mizutaii]|uniref:four helix bundle protein n=1 Tax=Sphingobacterium mizutaii TaxID=1010 RepID=UPI0016286FE2|nr:four helix bundle protein [Sphingobacterium mizutaii]